MFLIASGTASTSSSVFACLRSTDKASTTVRSEFAKAALSSPCILAAYCKKVFDTHDTAMRAVFSAAPPSRPRILRTLSVSSTSIDNKLLSNVVSHKSPLASNVSAPSNTRCKVKRASSRTALRVSSLLMRLSSRTKSPHAPAISSALSSSETLALDAQAHIAMLASDNNCSAAMLRSSPPSSLSTNAPADSKHERTLVAFTCAASRMTRLNAENPLAAASGCRALAMSNLHTVSQPCCVVMLLAPP
mmetsp:Transcript_3049/g.11011  ORF Transcript_3049/g.11011 Transcript_3049/m.11011 type:complete len:247 (-) Transcript_3049:1153-1893(-)